MIVAVALVWPALVWAGSAVCFAGEAGVEKLLGDESDGSRAVPIHLTPLYPENEDGKKGWKIAVDDDVLLPFSTRWTCGACHSYTTVSRGWHFNAVDANVAAGRPGQPWILVDASIGTQIPLSYRCWPGTFKPEQVGLTPRQFTRLFGRHTPGGGAGELESQDPDEFMREFVSGKLEINCLACHNADPRQDQAEYAIQISHENFRWAAAASCEFASVSGSAIDMPDTYDPFMPMLLDDPAKVPPSVSYRRDAFDQDSWVFFDIVRRIANERCYFCHSNLDTGGDKPERWAADEDVHLTAGLMCVDCHRNGVGHDIVRGYEGEDAVSENLLASVTSCVGCHTEGRLGAPVPKHLGIPLVHFDKLSCTACHSGPWPEEKTVLTKTSRAHRLGMLGINKSPEVLPHIMSVVFARQSNGKIAPHKLIWPAFWGTLEQERVTPIGLEVVRKTVGGVFADEELPRSGDWPALTSEDIDKALKLLAGKVEGKPVYVSGGRLYRLDRNKTSIIFNHSAARPYLWPIAHDVRPAAQSLGTHSCEDCHSTDAPFFFGTVAVDSPVVTHPAVPKEMVEFQEIDRFYARAFAFSFVFRPWLKVVALGCCAIIGGVVLLYALRALACVARALIGKN